MLTRFAAAACVAAAVFLMPPCNAAAADATDALAVPPASVQRPFEMAGPDLLRVGSFENLDAWSHDVQEGMAREDFRVRLGDGPDVGSGHRGAAGRAAILQSTSAKGRGRFHTSLQVPTAADIRISVWVKSKDSLGGIFVNLAGDAVQKADKFDIAGGDYDWTHYVYRTTTQGEKGGTAAMSIWFLTYGTGTYHLADVQVAAIEPDPAQASAWARQFARNIADASSTWTRRPADLPRRVDAVRGHDALRMLDELIAAVATSVSGSEAWGMLATNPIEKVFRDRPYRQSFRPSLAVDLARHEREGAQLLLFAYDETLRDVEVSVAMPDDAPDGLEVQVLPIAYGTRPRGRLIPWYVGEDSVYWPDALAPNRAFTVAARTVQPVYVRVYCPPSAEPGVYAGRVHVRSSAGEASMPLTIRVRRAAMPVALDLRTMTVRGKSDPAYIDLALEQRMGLGAIYAGMTWMRPTLPRRGGGFDFSEVAGRLQHAIERGQNAFTIATTPKSGKYGFPQTYTDAWRNDMKKVIVAYSAFLKSKGWFDLAYFNNIDEPWRNRWDQVKEIYEMVESVQPDLKTFVCLNYLGDAEELKNHSDVFDLYIQQYGQQQGMARQAQGKQVWWAVCIWPNERPNLFIEYPLVDARIIGWMAFQYDIDGFEYWSLSSWAEEFATVDQKPPGDGAWLDSPDGTMVTRWTYNRKFSNGDGYLVYPGDDNQPINSLRFEALRDGLEENQLLVQLRDHLGQLAPADRAQARALLTNGDGLVANYHVFNDEPATLMDRRTQVLDLLDAALR